jgi:hypothetical protein
MSASINRVISVCAAKHLSVWEVASRAILDNINSNEYEVVVPDSEVHTFSRFSPRSYLVTPESAYIGHIKPMLQAEINGAQPERFGWYLQQFIKLATLEQHAQNDLMLLWDADTVPLRPLKFTSNGEVVLYYTSGEYHHPYFKVIERLTGMTRTVDRSFIAQCFPVKGAWVSSLKTMIEDQSPEQSWLETIIEAIDFTESSGFSEYELLGTFISHRYPDNIRLLDKRWERRGSTLIGKIERLQSPFWRAFLKGLDFVSFEEWDRVSRLKRIKLISRRLHRLAVQ